MCRGE
jgi:hypothetical protein